MEMTEYNISTANSIYFKLKKEKRPNFCKRNVIARKL